MIISNELKIKLLSVLDELDEVLEEAWNGGFLPINESSEINSIALASDRLRSVIKQD